MSKTKPFQRRTVTPSPGFIQLTLNGEFVANMRQAQAFRVYENLDVIICQLNLYFVDSNGVLGFAEPRSGLKGALQGGSKTCDAMLLSGTDLRALIELGVFSEEQEAFIVSEKNWRTE